MKRLSSRTVRLGVGMIMALNLAACADDEPTHSAVCVDPVTEVRVDDDLCDDDGGHGHTWFYYPITTHAPAVGSSIKSTGGSYTKPASGFTTVPKTGGFGVKGGTTGG